MKRLLSLIIGVGLLAVGCNTMPGTGPTEPPAIGQPVQSVIEAHAGQEMVFFDKDGKQLAECPQQQSGSVSIYNQDHTGQDNYGFDEKGVVVGHKRSLGADYGQGVWRTGK